VNKLRAIAPLAFTCLTVALTPASAQTKPTSSPSETVRPPSEAALTVGALQIGSAANLEVTNFEIGVTTKSVTYSYLVKNAGTTELAVAASVALPNLRASSDGSETWILAKYDPENFVDLTVSSGGTPIATKAELRATALGVDRAAEIKANHLPLIPFGMETSKALAGLSSDSADRLAALGVTSLHDPAEPKAMVKPDWTLDVVHSWRQILPAGKTTPIVIKFVPVVAKYRLMKGDEEELDDIKAAVCLKPQAVNTLQSRLKSGGVLEVTEISLADYAPGWIESPAAQISVQKPRPDAVIAFCGIDEKTAGKASVQGVAPDDNDGIRIVIFEPATR
jgi:hypothetical protein